MSKRLLVLKGNKFLGKHIKTNAYDRIIFTSDLKYQISARWFDKVKTLSQYEVELKFSNTGFEEAHDLIEQWKRIPLSSYQNKQLYEVLTYESISILDTLQSNLQIYYLSRILGSIKLVEKIIEYEKPTEIFINSISDHITKAFFIIGQAKGIKVHGEIKSGQIKFYSNEILPLLRFAKSCCLTMLNKFQKRNFRKSRNQDKKPVIFLNFNRRNLDTAMPVYKEMERRGVNCLFIQNGHQGIEYLIKNMVKIRSFDEFNNFKINMITYLNFRRFIRMWKVISKDPNFQKYFIYHEANCWEVFKETIEMVFSGGSAGVIQDIELTKRIIKKVHPSAIVASEDRNSFVRSVFYFSKSKKISTILIQYGSISGGSLWFCPITADIMCVESKKEKQFLEGISGNQGKIVHTGQPRFDLLRSRFINVEKSSLLKKYNIDNERKVVLFTSVPYVENIGEVDAALSKSEYVSFLQCFYKAVKELSDTQFIVKPHPNENPEIHQEMLNLNGNNGNLILMEKEADTFELIYLCDLLITFHSTSGLEAVVLEKPVITVNMTGRPDPADYAEKGIAIGVYEEKNLCNAVDDALNNEETRNSLAKAREHYVNDYLLDGKAKERIGDVIEGMAKA